MDPRVDEPKLNMGTDELAMLELGAREPATDKLSSRYAISNRSVNLPSSMCSTSSMVAMHHVCPLRADLQRGSRSQKRMSEMACRSASQKRHTAPTSQLRSNHVNTQ